MFKKLIFLPCLILSVLLVSNCSDDKPETTEVPALPPAVEKKQASPTPAVKTPLVYIEELDQYQEYFKEQHETSFSHVKKKNWTSYTAGKDGILTKILLFGKPNYTISEHYGSSMSGFVRADNPDNGPKLGEWSLTREEIVNQLAVQGLTEIDAGWITLQMRGEIPQQKGRMYFIVCDQIGNKRPWFGAFAFAEGNPYKQGRFWLHPDHDLVFRTYVGKTADQLDKEQRGEPLFDSDELSLVPSNDLPASPKPMLEMTRNFEPSPPPAVSNAPENEKTESTNKEKPLYQPATQSLETEFSEPVPAGQSKPAESTDKPESNADKQKEEAPKRSLFKKFFQEEAD